MLRLIAFSNPRMAQAFVDYMATLHIDIEVRHQNNQVELWLADTSSEQMVRHELQQFIDNPSDPRYLAASWESGSSNANIVYRKSDTLANLRSQAGPLTLSVIVICVVVYGLMQVFDNTMFNLLAYPSDSSQYIQIWRWVSHAFLHFSLMHILFNLVWWWYLGGPLERRLGTGKLLEITVLSAILSGYGQAIFSGSSFGGLSGVVYALMGYSWLSGERAPERGIYMQRSLMIFALVWLAVGYFDMLGVSVANAAHIGGLVVGLALAWWDTRSSKRN
ncbi:rhomboid family intramembrane serine protease GlpG [Budvicia aquatica]|uniref:Rhomboid protease GlpG n=1 Tax=Budvicia aquatica TaxID=82979 RepID=A0A2C6D9U5_9GAMM|nr:rhomboid family intramembrane serine protease GlpG [Budvicia aquatica]MBP9642290.1 rhomboid family intramembrane serine protease GlpG [Budvicia sp.]PHI27956.1 rhomboid protease GlpG [Budvicia aquatica]VFS45700.1 Rhomboid protease glpG [Budvicia aquatica]